MSAFPQSFYALGRRWVRPAASRANWGLPPFDEAVRRARTYDLPWLTEAARADFAKLPESLGCAASVGRNPKGEDREDGLRAEHEHAVGEAETPNTSHRSTGE